MNDHQCCSGGSCCGHHGHVNRRGFLSLSAAAATAAIVAANTRDALAAGVLPDRSLVPAGKGAAPADLYLRGVPTRYTGTDLKTIGMPVGGGCCGQVYLGGDGRLWYWDVDNGPAAPGADGGGEVYAHPRTPFSPFKQGFVLKTTTSHHGTTTDNGAPGTTGQDGTSGGNTGHPSTTGTDTGHPGASGTGTGHPGISADDTRHPSTDVRSIDADGFDHVAFTGQYPIGTVDYTSTYTPIAVRLEAFSPFVPGEVDDSTLPVTVLAYTLTNTGRHPVTAELIGWSENPVCLRSRHAQPILLSSQPAAHGTLQFTAAQATAPPPTQDIVFENWEKTTYDGWTVEGQAFGTGPIQQSQCPPYFMRYGDLHVQGQRFVTSHNFILSGGDAGKADGYTGKLTSKTFTIERRYVAVWMGGGYQPGQACLNIVVDGEVVATATGNGAAVGDGAEPLILRHLDVIRHKGKTAHIEIIDNATGGWGHINVDDITFTDTPASNQPTDHLPDGGTFALAALDHHATVTPTIADWSTPAAIANPKPGPAQIDGGLGTITGTVSTKVTLRPGERHTIRYLAAWYFPVPDRTALGFLKNATTLTRHYAARFTSAAAVTAHVARDLPRLEASTREWVRTWYTDSTLPHWFLERTLATASTLATSTCLKFTDGRFYAWEGVDCCAGTCEHVWNYAQAIARLFPALERDTRQRVDLGIGFHTDTGEIGNRAEADMGWATDGQCGTILRIYREHQMSPDRTFLKTNWPHIKLALQWVMAQDTRHDGTLEGPQPNTLDAVWYGEIAWMTGMYDAALFAGAQLAEEAGDHGFAAICRKLAEAGAHAMATELWTGEYFIQIVDQHHPEAVNTNIGCHIDQLFGQSLALQLGLPRIVPPDKATTALKNLYRYNFVPDPAAYRAANTAINGGRWFAMAHEPAVVMTTFPHGGATQANGNPPSWSATYFNESWTGQEYQLAAHMVYEGLVEEGMRITRAVHDRYSAARRNPYNEIECSDHYARAMAGYGVFLAACGYQHHGPQGRLGFAPKISPENFAAAFTAAGGWGLYRQVRQGEWQRGTVEVRHGRVTVRTLAIELPSTGAAEVTVIGPHGRVAVASTKSTGTGLEIELTHPVVLNRGRRLDIVARQPHQHA